MGLLTVIVASTAAALGWGRRPPPRTGGRPPRWFGHPAIPLLAVTALVYLNQVLFTVYVLRVRHGDASFVARYLPDGWFALADHSPLVEAITGSFPAPGLLAPTVLRVQAFLELPFVIFAYLTVCRWLGAGLYRQAARLTWAVAAAWTATFCLIEWSFHNPYTVDDMVIRVVAAVVVPLWVSRITRSGTGETQDDPVDLVGLLVFGASVAAMGYLVLVVYDTALLYNLGHLGGRLPGAAVALAVLTTARLVARLRVPQPPGLGIGSITGSLRWFVVLFFVPAIPIRYGLGFGVRPVAVTAGLLVVAFAMGYGIRESFSRTPGRPVVWVLQMTGSLVVGAASGYVALLAVHDKYLETRLLAVTTVAVLTAAVVCALIDRLIVGPPSAGAARPT